MSVPPPQDDRHTVEEVFRDFKGRHTAILKALTTDVEKFYFHCDPEEKNLCLFGHPNEQWEVTYPDEEVPSKILEPLLGINFCRDGMKERDWLALVASHSDAWLLSMAFYFGTKFGFDSADRNRLFTMINELSTITETVAKATRRQANPKPSVSAVNARKSKSDLKGQGSASGKNSKKAKDEDAGEGLDEESEEDSENICGACGKIYVLNEFWICCDECDKWFHGKCVKVTQAQANHIELYRCPPCSIKRGRHNSF